MGLFDFLNKKEKPKQITETVQPATESTDAYLGDLEKTSIIQNLVQIPKNDRDEKWEKSFLENIGEASFRCGEPQVITGPDGYPYFQLFLPEPNTSFQCYVIRNMKDDFLLNLGYGVVINPSESGVDWVLSYGTIVNFSLNNEFYTPTETSFSKKQGYEKISSNEKVMVGQPSEKLLPKPTRHIISEFLKANGIANPKILLMMRTMEEGNVSQDLVFNFTVKNFNDENTFENLARSLTWYLPVHYSIVFMNEESFSADFMPL
ncbi:hypothetical protein [Flavobacterium tegetincola]|uniref:hypothetical protein n=1 Tax=Flavobacterium tegetincola TaxID=150172 RepID=UPI0004247988|nr:hypothetical protein [Flavobacterium tegetincola]